MEGIVSIKDAERKRIALLPISLLLALSFALAQESKQATPVPDSGRVAKWRDLVTD